MADFQPTWFGIFVMYSVIVDTAMWLVLSVLCVAASAVCEAVMDTLQFHYTYSVFYRFSNKRFWDPTQSWRNKYRNADPLAGPRFPGSTTIFVGLTDAWHMFKLLRNAFAVLAGFVLLYALLGDWWVLIYVCVARITYGIIFTISYQNFGK